MENLIDGLQSQMTRVREIIKEYESVPKNAGMFAASMMKISIQNAERSISQGNTIQMIACYKALEEYEL